MNSLRCVSLYVVALGCLLLLAGPSFAAFGWFSGVLTQSRVIQICIVTACIALFIMLKKFDSR